MHIGLENGGDGFNYDPSYSYASQGFGNEDGTVDEKKNVYDADGLEDGEGFVEEEEAEPISQEDYWTVISAYFEGKGLVRQQLESFNEFVENTIQEIVDENAKLTLDQYTQYTGNQGDETVSPASSHTLILRRSADRVLRNLANTFVYQTLPDLSAGTKSASAKFTSPVRL